ncbi:AT-rich interactive domain-containing protein 2 [Amaranthus tricolor]|uniref:AT-rich interactive domain-containing protein 2 n=1 Tax=Amaranthus tricolor TaxID=29722 RepID=UPI00258755A2|nr:AT-rich interactive domain-containing protein 2 [Amaranthus tricolor]
MEGWSIIDQGSVVNCIENGALIDGCSSEIDDDCDDKLRCLFDQVLMVLLRGVYAKNGSRPIPALLGDGTTVDLFKLFCLVRDRGGFLSVSEDKLWGLIAEKIGLNCNLCASLKLIYYKYLDELDQWLNRITRDRNLENGINECGGSLGLLSLELEKRLRGFSIDETDFANGDKIGYDKIYKHINSVSSNEKGTEVHDVVVKLAVDEPDGPCEKAKASANDKDSTRKRKRDMFSETLSWLTKVAKNPCHPSIGFIPRWKGNCYKDFMPIALSVREARLQKRHTDSNDQQSHFPQKKHKMHPSMYEDNDLTSRHSAEGLRCSKRLLSVGNALRCECCNSSSNDNCKLCDPPNCPLRNGLHKPKDASADFSETKEIAVSTVDDIPVEKLVLVGPQFQAEVPIWTDAISESDSKWLGTQIWAPNLKEEDSCWEVNLQRKKRVESCNCLRSGSVECYRFHVAESRMKLRHELGLAFFQWKFDRMGEEVSLSWSPEEEKKFKQIIRLDKHSLGKSFFPRKTRKDLVSYYYNVHLINRRSYQNRVTPKDIDSDDDETEFGSVSEAFGYNAVKIPGSEPLKCFQNEQVIDLD